MDPHSCRAARSWFGYGRWDAPYWFVGIGASRELDRTPTVVADPRWLAFVETVFAYEDRPAGSDETSVYLRERFAALDGREAVIELAVPQPAAGDDDESPSRYGFLDVGAEMLHERIRMYAPSFVVFDGTDARRHYEEVVRMAFDIDRIAQIDHTVCLLAGPGETYRGAQTGEMLFAYRQRILKARSLDAR